MFSDSQVLLQIKFAIIFLIPTRMFGLAKVGNQDVRLDDERRLYRE